MLRFLQIEYTIHRNNKGLGINIAGGKGSTPYIGNDEVGLEIEFCFFTFGSKGNKEGLCKQSTV